MSIVFRLPKKLKKMIHVQTPSETLPEDNPFLDWSAGVFTTEDDCTYIVLANTSTLYSTCFLAQNIETEEEFVRVARNAIQAQLVFFGFRNLLNEKIRPFWNEYEFSKALDASMTARVNGIIREAKMSVERGDTIDCVCYKINMCFTRFRPQETPRRHALPPDSVMMKLYQSSRH